MAGERALALVAVACALGLLLGAGNSEARLSVDDPHNRERHGAPLSKRLAAAKALCIRAHSVFTDKLNACRPERAAPCREDGKGCANWYWLPHR